MKKKIAEVAASVWMAITFAAWFLAVPLAGLALVKLCLAVIMG